MQANINGEPRLSLGDRLVRSSAAELITIYQRYISPYKGFRCAHRVHHGGRSCSAYAKGMVHSHGLGAAIPLIRQRFADCGQVARMMRSQVVSSARMSSFDNSNEQRRERNANCWADSSCDCVSYCLPDLAGDNCALFDGCDIGADGCDGCGDMDLSGCDGCDGCDVGGCCDF